MKKIVVVNMAGNENTSMDGERLITNAIDCISRLREMRPVMTNPGVTAPEQPTVASEIVRLFPTFASSRPSHSATSTTTRPGLRPGTRSNENAGNRNCSSTNEMRRMPTNSSRPRAPGNKKKGRPPKSVHKDLIFILNPAQTKVPTHKSRLRLERKGRVIHDYAFDRSWEEYRLRSAIEEEMPMLMNKEYEFLKVSVFNDKMGG